MDLDVINEPLPSNILGLPADVQKEFLSHITDPYQIYDISLTNTVFKNLLFHSITHLDTQLDRGPTKEKDYDPVILDIKWLIDYPLLESVSDNIVFEINMSKYYPYTDDDLDLVLPRNLRKFNIKIHVMDIKSYDSTTVIMKILHLIINMGNNLKDYMIRFISELDGMKLANALILEYGKISYVDDFVTTPLVIEDRTINKNIPKMFELLNIKLLDVDDNDDMYYLEQNPNSNYMLVNYLYKGLFHFNSYRTYLIDQLIYYVNKRIGSNDVGYKNIGSYIETGYIHINILKHLLSTYIDFRPGYEPVQNYMSSKLSLILHYYDGIF